MYRNHLELTSKNNNLPIRQFEDAQTPLIYENEIILKEKQIDNNNDQFFDSLNDISSESSELIKPENHSFASYTNSKYIPKQKKSQNINFLIPNPSAILHFLTHLPLPRLSVNGVGICCLISVFFLPRIFSELLLFPGFRLLFGNLYPAYASYKAVRTKNVKEYVKWMMYWIVFAFFSCIETFTDIFLSWFPFYYEVKVIIVLWLLSPATKGSSTLYRKFVHPMLTKRENEIDEYISQAKEKGYTAVLQLGSKGVNYATNVIMQTAIKTLSNGVQTSQSDNAIQASAYTEQNDLTDGSTELRMRRSKSADSALNTRQSKYNLRNTQDIIYEGSSEDEMILSNDFSFTLEAQQLTDNINEGSARSRDPPPRKTATKGTKKVTQLKSGNGIKGRRKIKEVPINNIHIEQQELIEVE